MTIRRSQIILVLFAFVSGLLYHSPILPVHASEYPDALLMYPDAKDVRSGKRGGTEELENHVDAKFPSSNVIGWISYKLQEAGWKQLGYDFLNPNALPSQARGAGRISWRGPKPDLHIIFQI